MEKTSIPQGRTSLKSNYTRYSLLLANAWRTYCARYAPALRIGQYPSLRESEKRIWHKPYEFTAIAISKEVKIIVVNLAFSVLNLLFMHYYIFLNDYMEDVILAYNFPINLATTVFDTAFLALFFMLLTWGKVKTSLILTYFTTLAWSFANVFYARFFYQYLSLSIIGNAAQLTDQAVVNSIMDGFQSTDIYYILSPMAFLFFCWWTKRLLLYKRFALKIFVASTVISYLSIPLTYSVYHFLKSETRNNYVLYEKRISGLMSLGFSKNAFPNMTRFSIGSVRVLIAEIFDAVYPFELTAEQIAAIRAEQGNINQRCTPHPVNDNISNVIIVVLESFLSSSILLDVEGKEITPFLNSLARDSSIYYNSHVVPNITIGESGDGQFIMMTGLLPLRDRLTVGEVVDNRLPAFPRLLRKKFHTAYSEIVIPSPPQMWMQEKMNKAYGIEKMFCNQDAVSSHIQYLNDEQLFTMAMNSDVCQRQPFFSMVLSYSTHQPYREPVYNGLKLNTPMLTNAYKNYLIACSYTDMWLHRYIDWLKQSGVFDNTLIVITADHHAHLDALGMGDKLKKELPLFIINGNIDPVTAWKGEMNQLDIYTTLLDVLGIDNDWHGLGHSVLLNSYSNSVDNKIWDLSEWIIMGDYFSK